MDISIYGLCSYMLITEYQTRKGMPMSPQKIISVLDVDRDDN